MNKAEVADMIRRAYSEMPELAERGVELWNGDGHVLLQVADNDCYEVRLYTPADDRIDAMRINPRMAREDILAEFKGLCWGAMRAGGGIQLRPAGHGEVAR